MIKDIEKIVYDRLVNSAEYAALDPQPEIFQEKAEYGTDNPVIIINSLPGRDTKYYVRIELFQFSIWNNDKNGITPIKNALAQIFNRWKSDDVQFSYLLNSVPATDKKTSEKGLHMDFLFKVFDTEY